MCKALVLLMAFMGFACSVPAHEAGFPQADLFRSGEGGYHTYRIPALATTLKGTLLAFCEGRKGGQGDAGDIDLLLRRSTDGGATWGPMQVVVDDGDKTCGNPCPIVDRKTGDIVLLITTNGGNDREHAIQHGEAPARIPWVLRSTDDGLTWSAPSDISAIARKEGYRWYATGPGHGVQLASGRMIAPCDHSTGPAHEEQHSHILYSDDAGHTWAHGATLPGKTNECIAVETAWGELYLNMRNYFEQNQRATARSNDGGLTFGPITHEETLVDPVCQASAISFGTNHIAFANPNSKKRENMTLRLSSDAGKTWGIGHALWTGPSAYSDLALLPNGDLACLYERGEKYPYEVISFVVVPKAAITGP